MRNLLLLVLALTLAALVRAETGNVAPGTLPPVDHMVYLTFLPEPDELMADAKANGLTVLRLDKTADRVVVTYKYPDGHTATLGYGMLGSAPPKDRMRERPTEVVERATTVVEREPEIVYVERPYRERVVYRDTWDDFWLPLTVGLGIGYISGHHHHYTPRYSYRGSWRGSHRWRH
jgi:hypothetical protein